MRRRWWAIAFLVGALGTAAFYGRDTSGLAILRGNGDVVLLRKEDIGRKPAFDLSLPVFGHLTFPRYRKLPFVVGGMSNYCVNASTSAGVLYGAKETFAPHGSHDHHDVKITWGFGKEEIVERRDTFWREYIECPYVFGSQPLVATLSTDMLDSDASDWVGSIRLPANGVAEPKLMSYAINSGSWKLKLEPRPWIAPAFQIRYDVSVDDPQHSTFLISPQERDCDSLKQLQIPAGRSATLGIEDYVDGGKKPYLDLYVKRVVSSPMKFEITRFGTGGGDVAVTDSRGRLYVRTQRMRPIHSVPGVDALQLGGHWIPTKNPEWSILSLSQQWDALSFINDYKNGQVIDGVIYTIVETRKIRVFLKLPDTDLYRGTNL